MFLKKLLNIQQLKLNKPTSNTKIISLSNIISSTFSIPILSNTPSHPHIQLSFAFVFSTLLPSSNLLTIPSYIYIYTLSNCTRISFQFNLSSQAPPPRSCIHRVYQFLASYQHRSRHKHGSTRYTSARMQHTFTPVCIVKPVFSLVTGHASLL